ncbi:MAG TPA: alpha/beta fold hydrolase [Longimicrobiaceae bacterium]
MTDPQAGRPPMVRARWEIRPRDGSPPIRGDLRAPAGPRPSTAIVICHGFMGFREWGFFPTLARALAARGHAAITFDFSHNGVGADGVDYSALDLFASATHTRNVDEIRMVLEAITSGRLFPQAPRSIGLFGHSRGGGEAIVAAAEDPRVDALVTCAAISAVDRWSAAQVETWERGETVFVENGRTHQSMPIGPDYWRDLRRNAGRLDIRAAAARLDVPWLILHGDEDETVPVREARVLRAAAGPNAQLSVLKGAGHTCGATHPLAEVPPILARAIEATVQWYEWHLRPPGPVL